MFKLESGSVVTSASDGLEVQEVRAAMESNSARNFFMEDLSESPKV
jgi:hypothetical protein